MNQPRVPIMGDVIHVAERYHAGDEPNTIAVPAIITSILGEDEDGVWQVAATTFDTPLSFGRVIGALSLYQDAEHADLCRSEEKDPAPVYGLFKPLGEPAEAPGAEGERQQG